MTLTCDISTGPPDPVRVGDVGLKWLRLFFARASLSAGPISIWLALL